MHQKLSVSGNQLSLGGQSFRLFAGSMHYFRIHPDYWEDRILQLKGLGCNTVETYMAWNLHEPREGEWSFSGFTDIERFIALTAKHGLHLIIRFSPYMCAEWENGGIPYWLLKDRNVRMRSRHPRFMQAAKNYYDHVIAVLKPHLSTNGGNIIATQVENEYGCTQNDTAYLQEHLDYLRDSGIDIPIMNCVWANERCIGAAKLPGTIMSLNFREGAEKKFERLERLVPGSPRICSEFWTGWFSAWGTKRHRMPADPKAIAQCLDDIFSANGYPILYMFHGGTNFGFMNGSNIRNDLAQFTITSYDYEAPLSESGQQTEYYHEMRKIAEKHGFVNEHSETYSTPIPPPTAYPTLPIVDHAPLFEQLTAISSGIESPFPLSMEECDQDYGYILYRTTLSGPGDEDRLFINELRDRAHIFVDGVYIETLQRSSGRYVARMEKTFSTKAEGSQLDILIENQGRANFPPFNQEIRGITENVFLNDSFVLSNWQHFPLPLTDLSALTWSSGTATVKGNHPGFYRAWLTIDDEPIDTYIHPQGWDKGVIFINGFNIGRYWNVGPQYSLYIPAPLLKQGKNEIIIFEEVSPGESISFSDHLITNFDQQDS